MHLPFVEAPAPSLPDRFTAAFPLPTPPPPHLPGTSVGWQTDLMTQLLVQQELLRQETLKRLELEQILRAQHGQSQRSRTTGVVISAGEALDEPPQSRYWDPDEHEAFLRAVELHGFKDLKRISADIKTRNMMQVRTHLQKYVQKLKRDGVESTTVPIDAKDRSFGRKRNKSAPPADQTSPTVSAPHNRSASCPAKRASHKERTAGSRNSPLPSTGPFSGAAATATTVRSLGFQTPEALQPLQGVLAPLQQHHSQHRPAPGAQPLLSENGGSSGQMLLGFPFSAPTLMQLQRNQQNPGGDFSSSLQLLALGTSRDFSIFPEIFTPRAPAEFL